MGRRRFRRIAFPARKARMPRPAPSAPLLCSRAARGFAGALALLAVGVHAQPARAQSRDTVPSSPPFRREIDFSVKAGAAHTTDWFRATDRDGSPGTAPAVSVSGRYWATPQLGFRATVGWFGGRLDLPDRERDVHNLHYELDLAWRPLAGTGTPAALRSAYAFLGQGGVTTTVEDADGEACGDDPSGQRVPTVCIPERKTSSVTVGGVGLDVVDLGRVAVFAEVSVRRYPSPARVTDPDEVPTLLNVLPPPSGDIVLPAAAAADRTANTVGAMLGVRVNTGSAAARAPRPPPPPPLDSMAAIVSAAPATGTVVVRSRATAEVYLVPALDRVRDERILCRLRPEIGSGYYLGLVDAGTTIRRAKEPQAYILVVRRGERERQIPVPVGRGETVAFDIELTSENTVPVCRQ